VKRELDDDPHKRFVIDKEDEQIHKR
jgi:hypothetical protein